MGLWDRVRRWEASEKDVLAQKQEIHSSHKSYDGYFNRGPIIGAGKLLKKKKYNAIIAGKDVFESEPENEKVLFFGNKTQGKRPEKKGLRRQKHFMRKNGRGTQGM